MFNRGKSWLPGLTSKPKNPHSLEHLKYLYNVLCKNQTVTEQNRGLLVETLRSISEILIWGDQNDSSVFDFFLEKNMLTFFLRYMRQKFGRFICVQLLQTLNILFENISNETSLYYLLSNNHINSIIVHKFDFSDEEVMAYYISFLKTLSLKLNKHTIHFFYNEHTNDFALYTEAIKFFNHSETMVRIAVRTITLNVYKVKDAAMLRYIRDRTAAPYFSNLVWFIGSHILDLDTCVRNDADHQSRDRLSTLVAEHLDHLHYINDILMLNIDTLNDVLSDQLLNRLLIPLYVYSLTKRKKTDIRQVQASRKYVSSVVSLFLLSQVFLIIRHAPLVRQLAEIIFHGDIQTTRQDAPSDSPRMRVREFAAPDETLEETLGGNRGLRPRNESVRVREGNSTFYRQSEDTPETTTENSASQSNEAVQGERAVTSPSQNSTDEEKIHQSRRRGASGSTSTVDQGQGTFSIENKPYLEAIFHALECTENDYEALFALCLLYAMGHNDGIHQDLMDSVFMPTERSDSKDSYNVALVERLIRIITLATQHSSKVRLVTLELSIRLMKQLVYTPGKSYMQDRHLACIENARECGTQLLRGFYKSEEIFLDMFEDEYREMVSRPLNVEYLTMDASILLPPTGTPLTGIDFNKRLPCGEVERARKAIRTFFQVRELSLTLMQEVETQLPLTKDKDCVKIDNILDLNNSDLIACTVITKDKKQKRFLVIDSLQMILVEPDIRRLGWGIVTFVGFLQNIEVTGDKEDSRSLHITVHKPASSHNIRTIPLLTARFIFDDHIRCMAAKQRLTKGRLKARQQKIHMIERLLDIPAEEVVGHFGRSGPIPGRSHPVRVVASSATTATTRERTTLPNPLAVPHSASMPQMSHDHPSSQSSASLNQLSEVSDESSQGAQSISDGVSVEQGQESTHTDDTQDKSDNPDEEVEVAEEATSEMAFQTLNQTVSEMSGRHDSSSHESSPAPQEIPMEDMSRKHKSKKKQQISRARQTKSRLTAELKQHDDDSRSSSQSPKRKTSASSIKAKLRGRATSLTSEGHQGVLRSRSNTPEKRHHSDSSPLPTGSRSTHSHQPRQMKSTEIQTNLTLRTDINDKTSSNPELTPPVGQSPKTLCSSQSPIVSLVNESEGGIEKQVQDSPKLLPPAEKLRSLSDISQSSTCSDFETSSMSSDRSSDSLGPPSLGLNVRTAAGPELSTACVSVETAGGSLSKDGAADQLTKLAKIVTQYKFENEEDETMDGHASIDTTG